MSETVSNAVASSAVILRAASLEVLRSSKTFVRLASETLWLVNPVVDLYLTNEPMSKNPCMFGVAGVGVDGVGVVVGVVVGAVVVVVDGVVVAGVGVGVAGVVVEGDGVVGVVAGGGVADGGVVGVAGVAGVGVSAALPGLSVLHTYAPPPRPSSMRSPSAGTS